MLDRELTVCFGVWSLVEAIMVVGLEHDWSGIISSVCCVIVSLSSLRYDCNEGKFSGRRLLNLSSIVVEHD